MFYVFSASNKRLEIIDGLKNNINEPNLIKLFDLVSLEQFVM